MALHAALKASAENKPPMHAFLRENRDALIARCKLKVSRRPYRAATDAQLANGVPLFLEQLTRTLEAEETGQSGECPRILGQAEGDTTTFAEIGVTATAHGKELLKFGYSVAQQTAQLDAAARGCTLLVSYVDPCMLIRANRHLLQGALGNLIQNALKFTHEHSEVSVHACASGDRVLIEVRDHCGGLPAGGAERMFSPFNQRNDDKSGLGRDIAVKS